MQTHLNSTNATKNQLISLITILEEAPDPRVRCTVDHDLSDLLTIALCTLLCGGESFYDMEVFGEVRLPYRQRLVAGTGQSPGQEQRDLRRIRQTGSIERIQGYPERGISARHNPAYVG